MHNITLYALLHYFLALLACIRSLNHFFLMTLDMRKHTAVSVLVLSYSLKLSEAITCRHRYTCVSAGASMSLSSSILYFQW